VLPPDSLIDRVKWLSARVLELTDTAHDLAPCAADLGYTGPPFRWDTERRFLLRAELDAAFFHLYRIERDGVDYILDTVPIVRRKDEQRHGKYRTKRVILEIYDQMAEAQNAGQAYTILRLRTHPRPTRPRKAPAATGRLRDDRLGRSRYGECTPHMSQSKSSGSSRRRYSVLPHSGLTWRPIVTAATAAAPASQ
jgi:hypothetical protein